MQKLVIKKVAPSDEAIADMYAKQVGVDPVKFLADAKTKAEKDKSSLGDAMVALFADMRRTSATVLPLSGFRFKDREEEGKAGASVKAATLVGKEFGIRMMKVYVDTPEDAEKVLALAAGLLIPKTAWMLTRQDQTPIIAETTGNQSLGTKFLEVADEGAIERFPDVDKVKDAYIEHMQMKGDILKEFLGLYDSNEATGYAKLVGAVKAFETATGIALSELRMPNVTEGHSVRVDFEGYREHLGVSAIGGMSNYFDNQQEAIEFLKNEPPFQFRAGVSWTPTVKGDDDTRIPQTDILGQAKLGLKFVEVIKDAVAIAAAGELQDYYDNVLNICTEGAEGFIPPGDMSGKRIEFQRMMLSPFMWINGEGARVTDDGRAIIPVMLFDEKRHIPARITGAMALKLVGVGDNESFKRTVKEFHNAVVKDVNFFGSRSHRKSGEEGKTVFSINLNSIHTTAEVTDEDLKVIEASLNSVAATPAE